MPHSLRDLVTSITDMDSEDIAEVIKGIRHNKMIAKPAAQRRARKAETNRRKQTKSKMDKLLAGMSEEERAALIAMLEDSDED